MNNITKIIQLLLKLRRVLHEIEDLLKESDPNAFSQPDRQELNSLRHGTIRALHNLPIPR